MLTVSTAGAGDVSLKAVMHESHNYKQMHTCAVHVVSGVRWCKKEN